MTERDEAARERRPGAAGHPEPGSQHDDGETVTVDEGPDTALVDGVPGADGEIVNPGGALSEVETEGKAIRTEPE